MLSKLKSMPGAAWLIVGVCVTALLMPTAALAAGITWTGIEGQNKNKADVTAAGQVETSPADLSSTFNSFRGLANDAILTQIYAPPSGQAAVVTSIHVSAYELSGDDPFMYLAVGSSCSAEVNDFDEVDPATDGVTVLPYSPGYVIPAGDVLCGAATYMDASVSVNGYLVPAADAPTTPQGPASAPLTKP